MQIETFQLERWMTTYELDVDYDITESGIYPLSLRELIELSDDDALLDELLDTRLGYSEARGTHELRAELASTYANSTADNVLITTGAIEANFLLFNTLLTPGDHVVAVHPAYQQLYSVPRGIGCQVDLWRLTPDNGFTFDLNALEDLVRPETRMIVLNTPHNPTGAALTDKQLRRIYEMAEAHDLWLLCDEAYRWLELPGAEALPGPGRNLGERAISTGTFSKPFGLPGLRIGWMIAPEEIVQRCWELRDYISLSPGKLNDRLALHALRNRERIFERNRRIVTQNLETIDLWIDENDRFVSWTRPHGGLLALLAYNLEIPSQSLANRLAEEYSVMLAPGAAFDYEHYLRVGIGQRPDTFEAGLERAAACFRDLEASGVPLRS